MLLVVTVIVGLSIPVFSAEKKIQLGMDLFKIPLNPQILLLSKGELEGIFMRRVFVR